MLRLLGIGLIGLGTIAFYATSLENIYAFIMVVVNGVPYKHFDFSVSSMIGFPLIEIIILAALDLNKKSAPVLIPAFELSLFMYLGTQISIFIVHRGLGTGTSLMQQAVFLILGLIGFIIARWLICHYFYNQYEATKDVA